MAVTDKHAAILHAQLTRRWDEYRRLMDQLDEKKDNDGLVSLVAAAFFQAARQRFMKDGKAADDAEVTDFVTSVRERTEDMAEAIDPHIAETQIKVAIEKLPPEANRDVDDNLAYRVQYILVSFLIEDQNYDEEQTREFVRQSRELAEEYF
jgi:hypothetical protein